MIARRAVLKSIIAVGAIGAMGAGREAMIADAAADVRRAIDVYEEICRNPPVGVPQMKAAMDAKQRLLAALERFARAIG
jgi:hypothetical protein